LYAEFWHSQLLWTASRTTSYEYSVRSKTKADYRRPWGGRPLDDPVIKPGAALAEGKGQVSDYFTTPGYELNHQPLVLIPPAGPKSQSSA
jgi:hypothetical protein